VFKICLYCGKEFTKHKNGRWRVFLNKQKYCSKKCFYAYSKNTKRPPFSKKWRENLRKSHLKTGKSKKSDGYILIYSFSHPFKTKTNYVLRSRLVMEKIIGRYLLPTEIVHHKGVHFSINSIKNRQDDSPENLQLFKNQSVHITFHNLHSHAVSTNNLIQTAQCVEAKILINRGHIKP